MTASSLAQQLADLLGRDAVLPPEHSGKSLVALAPYAVEGVIPQAVAQPTDRESIARLLQWAAEHRVSVLPRGGGVLSALGNPPTGADVVLDLSRYNRVLDFQPADLTATVEPGVTLDTLQRELAQGGKLVPLEAPLADRATLGGILAANANGPLRYSYGPARDWLIGISVVSAEGVETKAGGKVVKNVTGYDLNKLYTGSLGTLGVIVEATFKLAPLPEVWAALVASFPSVGAGIDASRSLIAQVFAPQGLQVINGPAVRRLARNTGGGNEPANPLAGELTGGRESGAFALAFFAGRPRAVRRRLEDSARLLRESGANKVDSLDGAETRSLLRHLTNLGWSGDTVPSLGLKVNLPPNAVGKLVAAVESTEDYRSGTSGTSATRPVFTGESFAGETLGIVADPGFGTVQLLRWPETPAGSANTANPGNPANPANTGNAEELDEAAIAAALSAIQRVREAARTLGGTAVVEHCPQPVKALIDVWGDTPAGAEMEIMQRIKRKFDPSGILNPGRFMGRL